MRPLFSINVFQRKEYFNEEALPNLVYIPILTNHSNDSSNQKQPKIKPTLRSNIANQCVKKTPDS